MNCKMAAGTRLLETVLKLKPKEKFTFNSEIKGKKEKHIAASSIFHVIIFL